MSQINTQIMFMEMEQNCLIQHRKWVSRIKTYPAAKYHFVMMKKQS